MKTILYFFIAGALFLGEMNCANAQQTSPSDKAAIQMLKNCYKAYNVTCATAKGSNRNKKLDSLQQRYCTDRMITKIRSLAPDFDLLGYNAYTDVNHLNTLTVTKDAEVEDAYVISYIQHSTADAKPVDLKVVIHVNVLEEADGLKIASIR